jgi:spore maturation protein CgeB
MTAVSPNATDSMRLMIVGHPGPSHVGGHLVDAARELGIEPTVVDVRGADGSRALQALSWRLRDRRPAGHRAFVAATLAEARRVRPSLILATGQVPLGADALRVLGENGARRVNFLTDDPFNPRLRARWFLASLGEYDALYSPRHANLAELRSASLRPVSYLPFACNPRQHHPDDAAEPSVHDRLLFIGGADDDRAAILREVVSSGVAVTLIGGYWDRYRDLRGSHLGFAGPETINRVTRSAHACLILVRRANRDGHVMRSFEAAAAGGCLLVEDTADHRELYGEDGTSALFFRTPADIVERVRWLFTHPEARRRLADHARHRIGLTAGHTYTDRLRRIIEDATARCAGAL